MRRWIGWASTITRGALFLKLAEGIAEGIFGLADAVGIKQETVTREDGHVANRVFGIREHSE